MIVGRPNTLRRKRNVITYSIGSVLSPMLGLASTKDYEQIQKNCWDMERSAIKSHFIFNKFYGNESRMAKKINLLTAYTINMSDSLNRSYVEKEKLIQFNTLLRYYWDVSTRLKSYVNEYFASANNTILAVSLIPIKDLAEIKLKHTYSEHLGLNLATDSLFELPLNWILYRLSLNSAPYHQHLLKYQSLRLSLHSMPRK